MVRTDLGMVTAYAYAKSQGYSGTAEQFATDMANLANNSNKLDSLYPADTTLSVSGKAADSSSVGKAVHNIQNVFSSKIADKDEERTNFAFELGGIDTSNGQETTRTDSARTGFIPIGGDELFHIIRKNPQTSGWYANALYYDKNYSYLGSIRPGDDQYELSIMRIPSISYENVAYIRFTVLAMNDGDVVGNLSNFYEFYIRKIVPASYTEKLRKLSADYDIIDLDFTNAGGISGDGDAYDTGTQRYRTVTAYPFPIGSKVICPDGIHADYIIWGNSFYDSGRFIGGYFGSDMTVETVESFDYSGQTEDIYLALSGKISSEYSVWDDCIKELKGIVKFAVPKKNKENRLEDRLSGFSGAKNIFEKIPFEYGRPKYYYKTFGNVIEPVIEDTRYWSQGSADILIKLDPGTYRFVAHYVEDHDSTYIGVGYHIWDSKGNSLVDKNSRYRANYDTENVFTLDEEETINIQWKSYIGNVFSLYLLKDGYDTLKTVSDKLNAMNVGEDVIFHQIYDQSIEDTILKYNATVEAEGIGYIWISDLHVNSLYPSRNKALKRQLRACAEIANRTNIKFICIGGDIIDRETSHDVIFSLINDLFSAVGGSRKPIVVLAGNHDDNPYTNPAHLTKNQVKALFVEMTDKEMIGDVDKCYYYFDENDYRIICLDMIDYPQNGTYDGSSWWGFSQAQVEWLGNVLKETNKKVILLCHQSLDESRNVYNLGNNGGYTADIRRLVSAYNEKTTVELYGHTYDFTQNIGTVLFNHAGHAHYDDQYYMDSLKAQVLVTSCAKETSVEKYDGTELVVGNTYRVVTNETGGHWNSFGWTFQFYPNREIGTESEATFDVVSVGKNRVNVFRVGAGEDRTFAYTQ